MPSGPINLDPNGFYILLTDIGYERQFHWGLYLATSSTSGVIFHLTNNPTTGNKWAYQTKTSTNVPSSLNLLVALKVGVLDSDMHDAVGERLAQVPATNSSRYGNITCRVWVKEALFALNDEGYLTLTRSVDYIEDEATMQAAQNKSRQIRTAIRSSGSTA